MDENKTPCPQRDPQCGEKSARRYCCINTCVFAVLAFFIIVGLVVPLASSEKYSGKLFVVLAIFGFLSLVHGSRARWLCKALDKELKIVDDASAYELERIALFSWLGVLILVLYQCFAKGGLKASIIAVFSDWLITLLLLSPIVILVGASWGKLYVESPNGKIFWPMSLKNSNK